MDELIEKARDLVRQVEEKVEGIRRRLNDTIAKIPSWLSWVGDRVRDGWDYLTGKLSELWTWIGDTLAYAGSPWTLSQAAVDWQRSVANPMSRALDGTTLGTLATDDLWQGAAAAQYKQKIPGQREAMTAVQTRAGQIGGALDSMHLAIFVFWGAVAVALVALIAALVTAFIAAASVVGAPAVPPAVYVGAATFLAAAGVGTLNLFAQADSAALKLQTAVSTGIQQWPGFAL
ncbi:MAG: hypothetical protein HGA44_06140 [Cellulomonadaceae bacterium]|nr:hypothetical protein [Cellulomonadaceae bacterium]